MANKKKELTERIIAVTEEIYENYPELAEFLSEMTDTMPADMDPDVNRRKLKKYYESLIEMIKNYKKNQQSRDSETFMKGVKIIRTTRKKQT